MWTAKPVAPTNGPLARQPRISFSPMNSAHLASIALRPAQPMPLPSMLSTASDQNLSQSGVSLIAPLLRWATTAAPISAGVAPLPDDTGLGASFDAPDFAPDLAPDLAGFLAAGFLLADFLDAGFVAGLFFDFFAMTRSLGVRCGECTTRADSRAMTAAGACKGGSSHETPRTEKARANQACGVDPDVAICRARRAMS